MPDLRPSPIAGTWYEGDPARLAHQVDHYLDQAVLPALEGEVVALIAPHAGHLYSGTTAGYAFKTVLGKKYDLVAVLSPLHDFHNAPLLTTAHQAYLTPLGEIPVDFTALAALEQALAEGGGPPIQRLARDREHSLEIELPFLQRALSGPFQLLPLMVRTRQADVLRRLGAALASVLTGRQALLVASSDLSHFYPEPLANTLDSYLLDQVAAFSPLGVLQAEEQEKGYACGAAAIAAVLWAASGLGATTVCVLHHSTSADQTHDRRQVVGYGAAVVMKK